VVSHDRCTVAVEDDDLIARELQQYGALEEVLRPLTVVLTVRQP